jgi:prepilin-type processing-associated H-X9-DG protein/prepilin-type N-terminal cleavage/methylation domain-containing protein
VRIPTNRQSCFTLIELLVVVAIISVLASMMLPALSKAKARGKASDCANNLRQIGIGMTMFAAENEGYIPDTPWGSTCNASWANCVWDAVIDQALGGKGKGISKTFHCPEQTLPWVGCPGCSCPGNPNGVYPRSYSINSNGDGIQQKSLRLGSIPDPAGTIYVAERSCPSSQGQTCYSCSNIGGPSSNNNRHYGMSNYLFVDGHVELLRLEQTVGTGSLGSPKGMWTVAAND